MQLQTTEVERREQSLKYLSPVAIPDNFGTRVAPNLNTAFSLQFTQVRSSTCTSTISFFAIHCGSPSIMRRLAHMDRTFRPNHLTNYKWRVTNLSTTKYIYGSQWVHFTCISVWDDNYCGLRRTHCPMNARSTLVLQVYFMRRNRWAAWT